jgi:hypothetical protein
MTGDAERPSVWIWPIAPGARTQIHFRCWGHCASPWTDGLGRHGQCDGDLTSTSTRMTRRKAGRVPSPGKIEAIRSAVAATATPLRPSRLRFARLRFRELRPPVGALAPERERRERQQDDGDRDQAGRDRPLEQDRIIAVRHDRQLAQALLSIGAMRGTARRREIMSAFSGFRSSERHDFRPGRSPMTRCGRLHYRLKIV